MKIMIRALTANYSALQNAGQISASSEEDSDHTVSSEYADSSSNSEDPAAKNVSRLLLASLSPMTPIERRDLFSLSKDSGWRVNASFDSITAGEAAEAITFLRSNRTGIKDHGNQNAMIPLLFRSSFKPPLVSFSSITQELAAVEEQLRICRQKEDKLSREYKDLVFLEKTIEPAQNEYVSLDQAREKYEHEKSVQRYRASVSIQEP